ncbi:MAG: MarR family winged helix-turn-helix transcriptional regulator [Nitrospiria bacterium]
MAQRTTDEGDEFTSMIENGLLLSGLLDSIGNGINQKAGQSAARWKVLGPVSDQPKTVADVARRLGHSRQAIQRVADSLRDDGLVKYLDNPNDRRADLLTLTEKGRKVLAVIHFEQRRWANRFGRKMGTKDINAVNSALLKLIEVLKSDDTIRDE